MKKLSLIQEVADEIDGKVYRGYSGRGMYGKQCIGISCDNATECIEVAASKGLRGAVVDQLGLGYIVYWPKIQDNRDENVGAD